MNFSSSTEPSHGAPSKDDLPVTPDKREDAPSEEDGGEGGEGTNATQHHPDPKAKPIPGVTRKYVPRSPYGQGND